jgi:hypothetical protein
MLRSLPESGHSLVAAISTLGIGAAPTEDAVEGCVKFIFSLFCRKGIHITEPHSLMWALFKEQGIDKAGVELLPPTCGAWIQHIRRGALASCCVGARSHSASDCPRSSGAWLDTIRHPLQARGIKGCAGTYFCGRISATQLWF